MSGASFGTKLEDTLLTSYLSTEKVLASATIKIKLHLKYKNVYNK